MRRRSNSGTGSKPIERWPGFGEGGSAGPHRPRSAYAALDGVGAVLAYNARLASCTPAINYLGLLALALPAGTTPETRTIGVQLVADRGRDDAVLRVGDWLECAMNR